MPPFNVTSVTPPSPIKAETPARFQIIFSQAINWSNQVKVICTITEPTFGLSYSKTKVLQQTTNTNQGYIELTFPESLGGASLNIQFDVIVNQTGYTPIAITNTVNIFSYALDSSGYSVPVKDVKKIVWTGEQFPTFDVIYPDKKEIYRNEHAFLHIHTWGLYGHEVFVELREYDNPKDIRPIKMKDESGQRNSVKKYQIRNNVLSLPYSMEEVYAEFDEDYMTSTERKCLEIYARVSKSAASINSGTKSELMYLYKDGQSTDPVILSTTTVKTIINEDDLDSIVYTKADCSVEFRPQGSYKGDYGFDWVRKGDTQVISGNPLNDHAFDIYMGKYCINGITVQPDGNSHNGTFVPDSSSSNAVIRFSGTNGRKNDVDDSFRGDKMFKRLIREYTQLVFKWNDIFGNPFKTYAPIMTLLIRNFQGVISSKTVDLDLYFDIKTAPQKIILEFNNKNAEKYITLDKKELTGLAVGQSNSVNNPAYKLKLTCSGEFQDKYTLFARAFGQNDLKGQICGMFHILPNAPLYQHKVKVVLFNVKTLINGTTVNEGKNIMGTSLTRMNEILGQAQLLFEYEQLDLDATDSAFKTNCCTTTNSTFGPPYNVNAGDYIIDDDKSVDLVDYLEKKRINTPGIGTTHDNNIRLYFINELNQNKDNAGNLINSVTCGFSAPWIINGKFTVCFRGPDDETAAHEVGHSLNLPHTFNGHSKTAKYTFNFQKTDNLMDYYSIERTLYYWQWKILNIKIP